MSPLNRAWARWTRIAHVIGNFQARLILTVYYFIVVPSLALSLKISGDPQPPTALSAVRALGDRAVHLHAVLMRFRVMSTLVNEPLPVHP